MDITDLGQISSESTYNGNNLFGYSQSIANRQQETASMPKYSLK